MAVLSTKSYYTQQSNDSSHGRAKAASDASYQYYNNMSWSMWLAMGPGNSKHIWSLWEQVSGNNRAWLFSTQTTGAFRMLFSWNGTSFSLHTTPINVLDYSWKHVAVTFTNGVMKCYVNGVLQSLTETIAWGGGAAGMHNPAIEHIIGSHSPSAPPADTSPNGSYSNFSIWSKVLSAAEISEIYNNGTPGNLSAHSAVANLTNWIKMDQTDSGSTLVDTIDSGANLTITESGTSGQFNQGDNYPANWQAQIAEGVWNALTASYATASTFGKLVSDIATYIDSEVSAIKAKTDNLPSDPADASDIAALVDALPTAAENAAEVLGTAVEGAYTLKQSVRLMLAALAGKVSGAPGGTVTIRDANDTVNRIVATVDGNGNRTAVTKDVS